MTLLFFFFIFIFISASIAIFFIKKLTPARYLYPGITTFIFLTILPIVSTILISLSNLGTGHFFSAKQTKNLFLQERYLKTSDPQSILEVSILKNSKGQWVITSEDSFTIIDRDDLTSPLSFTLGPYTDTNLSTVAPREIIDFFDTYPDIKFYHPHFKTPLSFFRHNRLATLAPLYKSVSHGEEELGIEHQKTKEIFRPNYQSGFFESDTNQRLMPGFYTWVGLDNYLSLFTAQELRSSFIQVLIWTLIWGFMSVSLTFFLGVSLAIVLNDKHLRLKKIYRNLLILPYSIPFFISVLIFKGMLNKDFGLINEVLTSLSLPAIPWLEHGLWAKVAVLMVNLWLGFPYMFLVTTGILQSIPENLYDAAKLDGAKGFTRFRKITLPLIMSAIAPLLIGSFAFNINNFVGIYLLTGGGPPMEGASTQVGQTDILISYTYRLAFEGGAGQDFGLASAIAVLIFIMVAFLSALNFRAFQSKMDHEK